MHTDRLSASTLVIDETFLPIGQMRQVTRVDHVCDARIEGAVDLGGHWVFPQHFPEDPIFPGALMVEAAGQIVALWAWANGHRGRPRLVRINASFTAPVVPGDTRLHLAADVKRRRNLCFGSVDLSTESGSVATVEVVLAVLDEVTN